MELKNSKNLIARGFTKGKMLATAFMIATATVAMPASAALTLDTAEALAIVAVVTAFIVTIGLSVLGLHFTAKGIKWAHKSG